MSTCLTSRSRTRSAIVAIAAALVPRPPTGRRAALLLWAVRRIHGIADWVAWRTEDIMLNLDDADV